MKVRHVIMIIFLIMLAIVLVCVKDVKTTKTLTCSVDSNFHGMDSTIALTIKVKNNKIKDMNIIIDSIIPEEYVSQKQEIINSLGADGRMKVTSTDEGIRLSTGMQSEYFKSLGLNTSSSYSELKEVLEFQGYTCE